MSKPIFSLLLFISIASYSSGTDAKSKCGDGKILIKGKCVTGVCGEGMTKAKNGQCYCKAAWKWEKRRKYCVPTVCPKGLFRGSDERCYCPGNMKNMIIAGKLTCVPRQCPEHHKLNTETGKCQLKCPAGMIKPAGKNYCVHINCPKFTVRDRRSGKCLRKKCPAGKILSEYNECVDRNCKAPRIRNTKNGRCELPPCNKGFIRPAGKTYCVRMACPAGSVRGKDGKCTCRRGKMMDPTESYCVPSDCGENAFRASDWKCYPCPRGHFRPGKLTHCVRKSCPIDARRDPVSMKCTCPGGMQENKSGTHCVRSNCAEGHSRDKHHRCVCSKDFRKVPGKTYCVPVDCGETHFRGNDERCKTCEEGKFRPAGSKTCLWKPCPGGRTRNADGKCPGKIRCDDNSKLSLDRKRCVPKRCPTGTRRDPVTENCIGHEKKKHCKTAYHLSKAGICVPDECRPGEVRAANGTCVSKKCPAGWILNGSKCIRKKSTHPTSHFCPDGTLLNPAGRCVAKPCPAGKVRASDRMDKCIRISQRWNIPCEDEEKVRTHDGRCITPARINCPAGSHRLGNRCFYGLK